ncbi:MAG: TonB-dependent receptor plug domain-containing protein, partial [Balneolales bacterium]|nr:TonB-dependent receptor plug domain-containing protein [Balneolales bacterium]
MASIYMKHAPFVWYLLVILAVLHGGRGVLHAETESFPVNASKFAAEIATLHDAHEFVHRSIHAVGVLTPFERDVLPVVSTERNAAETQPRALNAIINDIQTKSGYRFLFREIQVSGITVDFSYTDNWAQDLEDAISAHGLALRVSHSRRQVVMYTSQRRAPTRVETATTEPDPILVISPGIIVTGQVFSSISDSLNAVILTHSRFGPLGEGNAIRAMQQLPQVTMGGSLKDGIFVRGTNDDAFQVLLDGSMVYNRSHLFGLIDSFNADVIRTSEMYYDITPARYQGPPGGLLSLTTRTGSLQDVRGSAALTATSIRGNIDGPLQKGRSSWLLAGRTSLLNQSDILGTSDMVSWGLDVSRPSSTDNLAAQRVVVGRDFNARFHDLHGKLFFIVGPSASLSFSGYSGFNDTRQEVDRLTRGSTTTLPTTGVGSDLFNLQLFGTERFETSNSWGSNTVGSQFDYLTPRRTEIAIKAGFSYYVTDFRKEDFAYQRPGQNPQSPTLLISPFRNASELNHGHFGVDVQPLLGYRVGAAVHRYRTAYLEQSLNRSEFYSVTDSWLTEVYAEDTWRPLDALEVEAGFRLQYFSNGEYLRGSPRLRLGLWPDRRVQGSVSYAITHQFMYKLGFYNATTTDMWVQSDSDQPPTRAETVSAGVSARLWRGASMSLEGYMRRQQHLRLHEINIQLIERPLEGSPWYTQNEGFSQGLEVSLIQDLGFAQLMQAYTWSEAKLRNPL